MQENRILKAEGIRKQYKDVQALQPTSLSIEPGKIYGLLGRNGAGKTTLLSILTAQAAPTAGTVTYGGAPVWENRSVLEDICFSREINTMTMFGQNGLKIKDYIKLGRIYYKNWDDAYAQRLLADFELNPKKKVSKLSKGMTSMVTILIGLASRAPLTIMDEPVAGLDVPMRDRFYQLLLDDYAKTGRTFIVATHIIEEAAPLFEEILLLDKGNVVAQENTEAFLARYTYVTGRADEVDAAVQGLPVLLAEELGRQKTVCVEADAAAQTALARQAELELAPVPLQKLFVYLTGGEKEGNIA